MQAGNTALAAPSILRAQSWFSAYPFKLGVAAGDPAPDGFVIWMPTTQPLFISNFGFRYSLQVAQLFGVDFGFGILKIGCRVDFVRV